MSLVPSQIPKNRIPLWIPYGWGTPSCHPVRVHALLSSSVFVHMLKGVNGGPTQNPTPGPIAARSSMRKLHSAGIPFFLGPNINVACNGARFPRPHGNF